MEKGEVTSNKKRRFLTLGLAVLIVGIIATSLIYRGEITGRATGENEIAAEDAPYLTEVEAANLLVEFLNKKYGDATFFRSEDLGSIYLIVIEHEKQKYDFFITKDGRYFSNTIEKVEIAPENPSAQ